jgi:hypothetical protein
MGLDIFDSEIQMKQWHLQQKYPPLGHWPQYSENDREINLSEGPSGTSAIESRPENRENRVARVPPLDVNFVCNYRRNFENYRRNSWNYEICDAILQEIFKVKSRPRKASSKVWLDKSVKILARARVYVEKGPPWHQMCTLFPRQSAAINK